MAVIDEPEETLVMAPGTAVIVPPLEGGYRRYALFLLMLVFMVNFVDRQVINILAEPIKQDLKLADWQIGMMTGLAFALCYSTFGMPIARLAERKNRPYIIGASITLWSGFTTLCSVAQNFTQLVLFRVGVGIGEAGCTPPAHSLIMDYSPPEKRASAIAFYHMGVPLGSLVGLALGGVIADLYGWRVAFLYCGLPGVLVAILVALTLREPRSALRRQIAASTAHQPTFVETVRYLGGKRSFWLMSLGAAMKAFVAYGQAPFTASFFYRVHGDEVAALAANFGLKTGGFLGLSLGIIGGLTGMLGTWIGGQIADYGARRDLRAFASIPAVAALLGIPVAIGVFLAPDVPTALGLMVVTGILGSIWSGPVHAGILGVAPPNMRATTSSILLFILNGIGLGLGPLCVGALSDFIAGPLGYGSAEGVRWALVCASLVGFVMAALFWLARGRLREDTIA
jgi:MFS family permease